jgi:hypothetical protein
MPYLLGMEKITLTVRRRMPPDLGAEGTVFRHPALGILRVVRIDGRPVGSQDWDVDFTCMGATPGEAAFLEACEADLDQSLVGAGA